MLDFGRWRECPSEFANRSPYDGSSQNTSTNPELLAASSCQLQDRPSAVSRCKRELSTKLTTVQTENGRAQIKEHMACWYSLSPIPRSASFNFLTNRECAADEEAGGVKDKIASLSFRQHLVSVLSNVRPSSYFSPYAQNLVVVLQMFAKKERIITKNEVNVPEAHAEASLLQV